MNNTKSVPADMAKALNDMVNKRLALESILSSMSPSEKRAYLQKTLTGLEQTMYVVRDFLDEYSDDAVMESQNG